MDVPHPSVRQRLAIYLDDLDRPQGQIFNIVVVILILLSCSIFVAQTYSIPEEVRQAINIIDWGILVAFAIEYILRLWCAENKLAYVLSVYAIIDAIALLPFFLGAIDISFVRLLRWFRVLHLLRYIDRPALERFGTTEDRIVLIRILFTLFSIVFVYSGFIYQVETRYDSEFFETFFDAFYFSVVTMTTVGYGDITPVSETGRLFTLLMIWTGVTLIPWQLGNLIRQVVKTGAKVRVPCSNCALSWHDADAQFCKACGSPLEK